MSHASRLGLVLLFGSVLGFSGGCSSEPKALSAADAEEDGKQTKMREVGEMFNLYKTEQSKPPKSVADLAKYETGFQIGYLRIKEGEVVVLWGAPIQADASDKILAYEKSVPESGGYVLMQDGLTVKKLSADEFKAAPQAPGSVTPTKAAK